MTFLVQGPLEEPVRPDDPSDQQAHWPKKEPENHTESRPVDRLEDERSGCHERANMGDMARPRKSIHELTSSTSGRILRARGSGPPTLDASAS